MVPLFANPSAAEYAAALSPDVGPDGRFVVKRKVVSSTPGQILVLDGWDAADPSRAAVR